MDWLRVAFGLIREAVGTEAAQPQQEPQGIPREPVNLAEILAHHRAQVDRNLETMVEMLNAQNQKLTETIRRQRIWNIALAAGLVIASTIALLK